MSSLYILEIKSLSKIGKYIFLFHLAATFFSDAEAFKFDESHLFILFFMSFALGDISVKILPCGMSEIFLLMFSSRTFMLL